ncbi:uncharacterized protein LOC135093108 [Scylla paramamosain]|uniref:uncharacterized protein LOC135093108 n=1 Tax=Scylla paramamosain TaxID=85552 RepID=UPI00308391A1
MELLVTKNTFLPSACSVLRVTWAWPIRRSSCHSTPGEDYISASDLSTNSSPHAPSQSVSTVSKLSRKDLKFSLVMSAGSGAMPGRSVPDRGWDIAASVATCTVQRRLSPEEHSPRCPTQPHSTCRLSLQKSGRLAMM